MSTPQDLPLMLVELEHLDREPDGQIIPYAFNWLTDPGAPASATTDESSQYERMANTFALSLLHIADERDSLRSALAAMTAERDRLRGLLDDEKTANEQWVALAQFDQHGAFKAWKDSAVTAAELAEFKAEHLPFVDKQATALADMSRENAKLTADRDRLYDTISKLSLEAGRCSGMIETLPIRDAEVERRTVEAIAEWLDAWDPTVGEAIALVGELWFLIDEHDVTRDTPLNRAPNLSFENVCLLVMAALRAGAWRKAIP